MTATSRPDAPRPDAPRQGAESLWLQPGQVIIREGDVSRELFVLLSGELSVTCRGEKIARITMQGEVVGELGALTGQPRTATVLAASVSEVLLLRNATALALERMPQILEKIDGAVVRRFQIVFNKTLMYKPITATLRRMALQEALRESLENTRRPGIDEKDSAAGILRHQIRTRIDERLAMYPDADDPKILERIAMEYGAQDAYRDRINKRPWLEENLIARMNAIESTWRLLEDQKGGGAVIRKAENVIKAHELLQDYETMPGIRQEMDMLRMESIVPLKARIEALKMIILFRRAAESDDERARFAMERRIKIAVDGARADAGADTVLLLHAARELKVDEEYEAQIRNLVAMSETGTHFIDMSGAIVTESDGTNDPPSNSPPVTTMP
jgi:CRP-like cAMP-binding protein